jgi:hypothetical protein
MKEGLRWPIVQPEYYLALARLAQETGDTDLHDTALAKMLVGHGRRMQKDFQQWELRSYRVLE